MDTKNIELLTHSSIRLHAAGKTLYVDPFSLRETPHDADLILITHEHFDHFSPVDIEKVGKEGSVFVVPETMRITAEAALPKSARIISMKPGESVEIAEIRIEALPAYNIDKDFHPKENAWLGYVVWAEGSRVYVAGDTDATEEAKGVKCDFALIPVGGTYTMDAEEAAALVNAIKPAVAIPTHYGSVAGAEEDARKFAALVSPDIIVEIKKQY